MWSLQGEPASGLFVVISGSLELSRLTAHARQSRFYAFVHVFITFIVVCTASCVWLFSGEPGPTTAETLRCGDVLGSFPAKIVQRGTVSCTTECVCLRLRGLSTTDAEDRRGSLEGSSQALDKESLGASEEERSVPHMVEKLWIFAHLGEKKLLEDATLLRLNTGDQVVKQGGDGQGELMILVQASPLPISKAPFCRANISIC